MIFNIDNIVLLLTFLSSAVALYFSLKKQKHDTDNTDAGTKKTQAEEDNLDSQTITSLYKLIHELQAKYKTDREDQDACYDKLSNEFKAYKVAMNDQVQDIVNENVKLRRWAKRLATQLEQAGIIPVTLEL